MAVSWKSKPMMVRIPREHAEQFEALLGEFGGLPPASVLRMILLSFLDKPIDEQLSCIQEQIRGKNAASRQPPPARLAKLNRNTHRP